MTSLKRRTKLAVIMVGAAILTPLLSNNTSASGQTIAGAKAQAAAIAAQLNYLGVQVTQLVQKYDQAQQSLSEVNQEVRNTQAQIDQTQAKIKSIKSQLAREAINAYVTSGNLDMFYTFINESPTQASVRQEYLNTVTNSQSDTVASYQAATHSLQRQQKSLKTLQAQAISEFNQVTAAKAVAQNEVDKEKAQLDSVNATLTALVAQQQAYLAQQAAAAAAAAAAARARQLAANSASNTSNPTSSNAANPTSSVAAVTPAQAGYANPLRSIGGLSPERIDQGVDYGGYGPIYAIGAGVVLSTTNSGWPGGTFISYRLTSGPAAGLVAYVAEDVEPHVVVGQSVTSATLLGTMYAGFDGIETGWADPSALGETMAAAAGQFNGSNSTAFGFNFSQLLRSLGSPGGVLQNNPATGSLPPRWPQW